MVSLGYINDQKEWKHFCGGTIISDRIIITAAHCLAYVNDKMFIEHPSIPSNTKLLIRAGNEYLNTPEPGDHYARTYEADAFKMHPKYNSQNFDVALVATNQTIKFNKLTKPICMPESSLESGQNRWGHGVKFTGWGFDDDFKIRINDSLKDTTMSVFYPEYCSDFYASYAEHHFCAGNERGNVGSCKGDSGGPLIYYNSRADPPFYMLIGVLHGSSDQCEDEKTDAPSIFARVDHPEIFDFIKKTKHDLELCQELKDCFCELANVSC